MKEMSQKAARILIADQHEITRIGLRSLIEENELEICGEAINGLEAVTKTVALRAHLVIVNAALPLLNGIEVAKRVQAKRPEASVMIFTEVKSERLMLQALKVGVRAYILKSDGISDLLSGLQAVLHGHMYISRDLTRILQNMANQQASAELLSTREKEIVQLLAEGHQNYAIAQILSMSAATLDTHRTNIYKKLQIHTTAELIQYALRNEIVQLHDLCGSLWLPARVAAPGLHNASCL
jgi:DNA-binding NarL/FixJ family response regulator